MKKTGKILLIIGGAFLFIAIIFGCIYFVTAENKSVSIIGGAENIELTRKVMAIMLFQNPLIIFGSLLVTLGTPTLIAGIILLILNKKKEKELELARAEAAAKRAKRKSDAQTDDTPDTQTDIAADDASDTQTDAAPDAAPSDIPADENGENA